MSVAAYIDISVAMGRPVDMAVVARSILYLASESWSRSVHGHVLRVDCGKQGKLHWAQGQAPDVPG